MKRAIGIALILTGIGILVASGYLFPDTVHRLKIDQDLFPPTEPGINWIPFISGLITFIGATILLASKGPVEEH